MDNDNREMNNFEHHAYAPSTNFLVSGPNFTALFNIAKNVYVSESTELLFLSSLEMNFWSKLLREKNWYIARRSHNGSFAWPLKR